MIQTFRCFLWYLIIVCISSSSVDTIIQNFKECDIKSNSANYLLHKIVSKEDESKVSYILGSGHFHVSTFHSLAWDFEEIASRCDKIWVKYAGSHYILETAFETFFDNVKALDKDPAAVLESVQFWTNNFYLPFLQNCDIQYKTIPQKIQSLQFGAYIFNDPVTLDVAIKLNDILSPTILQKLDEILTIPRNKKWIQIPELVDDLHKGSTLIVVGLEHLKGEQGMLNLISNTGFRVEPFPITMQNFQEEEYQMEMLRFKSEILELFDHNNN